MSMTFDSFILKTHSEILYFLLHQQHLQQHTVLNINIIVISHFAASASIVNILVNSIVICIADIIRHRCYRQSRHCYQWRHHPQQHNHHHHQQQQWSWCTRETRANPMRSLAFTTHQNANYLT
jgi:hypothetical protein